MAERSPGNKPVLASAGKQTNPADQTVHADTGALLDAGALKDKTFEIRVIAGGSAAAIWQIQRRNAANAANVGPSPYSFYTIANGSGEFVIVTPLAAGERVRVTNDGAITGTTAATIHAEALL